MKLKSTTLLILTITSICSFNIVKAQEDSFSPFDEMRVGYNTMAFLASAESKKLEVSNLEEFGSDLRRSGLIESKVNSLLVANTEVNVTSDFFYYDNKESTISLYLEEFSDPNHRDERWKVIKRSMGVYSGINYYEDGFYYLTLDSSSNNSLSVSFKTHYHCINIRKELPFSSEDAFLWDESQQATYSEAVQEVNVILDILVEHLTTDEDKIYKPLNGRILSVEERIYGLVNFWTEVKYNFAFFDQVPDLDWDGVLIEYLPKVSAEQSNFEYYRLMQEICALLQDGHTNVYLPVELESENRKPKVIFKSIEGTIYVTNTSVDLKDQVPLGSQLLSVQGIPVEQYLSANIYPYISSSTEYIRRSNSVSAVLAGDINELVTIEIKSPSGEIKEVKLERSNRGNVEWVRSKSWGGDFEYQELESNIAYVSLNSFGTPQVYEEFTQYLDSIRNSSALIIDLRKNGGGNSGNGYEILKYFSKKSFQGSKWATREHLAAFKAWGSFINEPYEELSDWERKAKDIYDGNYWYESEPDEIQPYKDQYIDIPTVILIGNTTASAAEDFLIAAESIPFGTTVGDYTSGSTGQPLFIRLPGGGRARICTKKDTYPDGREFVGYGIKPEHIVRPGIEDVLNDRDVVLEYAIEFLEQQK